MTKLKQYWLYRINKRIISSYNNILKVNEIEKEVNDTRDSKESVAGC